MPLDASDRDTELVPREGKVPIDLEVSKNGEANSTSFSTLTNLSFVEFIKKDHHSYPPLTRGRVNTQNQGQEDFSPSSAPDKGNTRFG